MANVKGYSKHITLSTTEKNLWRTAKNCTLNDNQILFYSGPPRSLHYYLLTLIFLEKRLYIRLKYPYDLNPVKRHFCNCRTGAFSGKIIFLILTLKH